MNTFFKKYINICNYWTETNMRHDIANLLYLKAVGAWVLAYIAFLGSQFNLQPDNTKLCNLDRNSY